MFEHMYINLNLVFKSFYKRPKLDFTKITNERNEYLKKQAINLKNFFNTEKYSYSCIYKYSKMIERINAVSRRNVPDQVDFGTKIPEEKYLLFIYTVDPEFENAIIYLSNNKKTEIRNHCIQKFGIYDPNLIKIELQVIKQFLKEEQKKEIYNKAEEKAFK